MQKYQKGIEFARCGLLVYLVIGWPDGVYGYRLRPYDLDRFVIAIGGRVDRSDAADIEPVVHVPAREFKKIS